MRQNPIRRRLACLLAVLTLAVVLYEGYGQADTGALPDAADTMCSAQRQPVSDPVHAQIRYDSGQTLGYASVAAMFAQLGAQEQPGIIRSVQVRTADGRWVDASRARYVRAAHAWQAYDAGTAPAAAQWHSYAQLLAACARGRCA